MAQEKAALSKIAGGNLAHMLWQRCISQKEFAAIVDRTPRTVRRWMYEGIPTLDDLQTITEALGVSVMDILSDSEDVHYFYMRGNLMSVFGKVPRYCNRWEKTIFPTYVTKYAVIIRVGAKRACLCGNFFDTKDRHAAEFI